MELGLRKMGLAALLAVVAAPAAADAQVRASGFSPDSGQVGTEVTVTGSGFTPDTRVIFGRAEVEPIRVTPRKIVIRVPEAHGDGRIILRHPGVGGDIDVGRFRVAVPLEVHGFAPSSGIPGTRVVIRGSGFDGGVQVTVGGAEARVLRASDTRITIAVPDGARTGVLRVVAGNTAADAPRSFQVLARAPSIDRVTPAGGPPGTVIRIEGANLGADAQLSYGPASMEITGRGPGFLEARIPASADRDRFIRARTGGGAARTSRRFQLDAVPVISRFEPTAGLVDERIEVYGANFRAGDRFTLGGQRMRILQLRSNRVSLVVPRRAPASATIVVHRGEYRASSQGAFELLRRPRIQQIEPEGGPPGQTVTIVGRHLDDAEVFYGERRLRVRSRGLPRNGSDMLTVRIPRNADDHRIRVRTRGGTDQSRAPFRVHHYASVSRIRPSRGTAGTRVTLYGDDLRRINALYLGATRLPIRQRTNRKLMTEIPAGASSGELSVVSHGVKRSTGQRFDVVRVPIIDDVNPHAGVPGTEVVITGRHFAPRTRVFLGKLEMPVLRRVSDRQITVVVPRKARRLTRARLYVGEGDLRVSAPRPFVLLDPPTLARFSPRTARPGDEVTLRGREFTMTTQVVWQGHQLTIRERRGSTKIVVALPDDVRPGKGPLVLREDGIGVAVSKRPLTVVAPDDDEDDAPAPPTIRDHRRRR